MIGNAVSDIDRVFLLLATEVIQEPFMNAKLGYSIPSYKFSGRVDGVPIKMVCRSLICSFASSWEVGVRARK